ncbi:hypothetical protein [Stakelama pacifica]|uniref:Uncharacterized protein n=1 Tax=Stakelama pacifica TaxID=517720 RepID=A0A4V3BTG8_9SPHN|nr:hypothetical protein [Stakelama pacifica]TDN83018.1 hypothetical protein EV664_105216 [Stakelama pacifica]GGO94918.1 hypothetical protein GCM10011329_17880 [Stakelama pacifica]
MEINQRCCAIADRVEPRYRSQQPGARAYSCTGHVAKLWGAAYEGARLALTDDSQVIDDNDLPF